MAIRKVARMGHPILRTKARTLSKPEMISSATARLIEEMVDSMNEYGGIGLAAPQIYESLQVALIDYDDPNDERESHHGALRGLALTPIVNPVITVLDPETKGYWEGCLSVPELRGFVERPQKIKIDYYDLKANKKSIIAEGFLATVFQHELDHLFGTLFVDRIQAEAYQNRVAFTDEFEKHILPHLKDDSVLDE